MDFLEEFYNGFSLDILEELYVGETGFISELIEEVSKARAPYVGKMKRPIKGNKDFIKIGDMLAEEFGFHAVTFSVPFDQTTNAFTFPITMNIDQSIVGKKPKFIKDKGLKYDENVTGRMCIMVAVTAGVWFNSEFTDREVVAAILHEIGHSFVIQSERMIDVIEANRMALAYNLIQKIIIDMTNPYGWTQLPQDFSTLANASSKGKEVKNKVARELANNPLFIGFNGVAGIMEWFKGIFTRIFMEVMMLFAGASNLIAIPFVALNKILSVFNKQAYAIGRSQEYLSDSFASMYGLGPEISSFLVKIEYSSKTSGTITQRVLENIPVVGALHQCLSIPVLLMADSMNTHPSTISRIDKILDELDKELKSSDLSPKTKEAVKKNIKDLERIKQEAIAPQKNKKYNAEMIKRMWFAFLSDKGTEPDSYEKYYTDLKTRDDYVKKESVVDEFIDNIELI